MLEPEIVKAGMRAEDVTTADVVTRFAVKTGPLHPSGALYFECSARIEAFGRDYVAREVSEQELA
jgi:hypothetical protein